MLKRATANLVWFSMTFRCVISTNIWVVGCSEYGNLQSDLRSLNFSILEQMGCPYSNCCRMLDTWSWLYGKKFWVNPIGLSTSRTFGLSMLPIKNIFFSWRIIEYSHIRLLVLIKKFIWLTKRILGVVWGSCGHDNTENKRWLSYDRARSKLSTFSKLHFFNKVCYPDTTRNIQVSRVDNTAKDTTYSTTIKWTIIGNFLQF